MQVTRHDINTCTVKLDVVCDPEVVAAGLDKALRHASKRIKVPGFRPGTAPKAMVRSLISEEDARDLAAEHIVKLVYKKAIEDQGLKPYRPPKVEITALDLEESKCEFTVTVPLQPVVKLGNIEALKAEKPTLTVTDEEVEEQLVELRKSRSTREAVTDRGAHDGDSAVVNIKPLEGGDDRNFMTIVGQTFPELDAAIRGMSVDEVKQVTLTFPPAFGEKDWAGKEMGCQITIRSMNTAKLPELDEEFAKTLNTDNVDELRSRVRDGMARAKGEAVEEYVNEQLLEALLRESEVAVPDTLWEDVARRKLSQVLADLREAGRTLEDYSKEQGMTAEEMIAAIENESKTQVLRAQLVNEVFTSEKLTITDQDLSAEVVRMAREFRMGPRELWNTLKKNNAQQEVNHQAIHRKVLGFLRSKAQVVEVGASSG